MLYGTGSEREVSLLPAMLCSNIPGIEVSFFFYKIDLVNYYFATHLKHD